MVHTLSLRECEDTGAEMVLKCQTWNKYTEDVYYQWRNDDGQNLMETKHLCLIKIVSGHYLGYRVKEMTHHVNQDLTAVIHLGDQTEP